MTYYGLVFVQGWPLNTGKSNKERQALDSYRVAVQLYEN